MKASNPQPVRKINSVAELARYLNLSDWTVSRSINGHPAVKTSTRERVLQAMKEVGFQPNPIARGLRGKGTRLVGVCFNELRNTILIEKLSLLEVFLHEHGLRSIMAFTGDDEGGEIRAIEDFRNLRVDAVLLVQSCLNAKQTGKLLSGCKWVHLDPKHAQEAPFVIVDRVLGMGLLLDHLVSLGHRRFGLLGIHENDGWRWPGLMAAMRRHDLDPRKSLKMYLPASGMEASYEMGVRLAQTILAEKNPPTALISINDRVAVAAMQHLIKAGRQVPGDFSITGFDNLEIAHHLQPTLTTVDQRPSRLMEVAGEMLLRQFKSLPLATAPESCAIKPALIIGESTGKPFQKRIQREI